MIDPTERRIEPLEIERLEREMIRGHALEEEARAEAEKWRTIAGDYTDVEPFPWEEA